MDLEKMLLMMDDNRKPFIEKRLSENTFVRVFNHKAPDHLFKWHKDENPRIVIVLNNSDWKFQFDDSHPFILNKGMNIAIPKDYFHRVIKGTTPLWVKVTESSH